MSTTESVKYVISDRGITFYKDKQVLSVSPKNSLIYHSLKSSLRDGVVEIDVTNPAAYIVDLIKQDRTSELSKTLSTRINEMKEAGMPLEPICNFIRNTPEDTLMDNLDILGMVGTVDMPLTWEGDVVLYQRASWANTTDWVGDFKPGQEVEGDTRVGAFSWAVGACPDAGPVFEVVVKAKDLQMTSSNQMWKTKRLTQVSQLGLRPGVSSKASTPVVEFLTNCVGADDKNVVRLPYSAGTAAKMVSSMFKEQENTLRNNVVKVERQAVSCF